MTNMRKWLINILVAQVSAKIINLQKVRLNLSLILHKSSVVQESSRKVCIELLDFFRVAPEGLVLAESRDSSPKPDSL